MARLRNRSEPANPLRRAIAMPVWADVGLRIGAALGLICVVVLVHWLDRDGLKDSHDGTISLLDVVYFTMISITTTGFGDIAPVSDRARLIEAVIVTPIRLAVIYIFVGTAYNFLIKRSWETWHMRHIQNRLENHIVVLGFGVSGSEAVCELIAREVDRQPSSSSTSTPAGWPRRARWAATSLKAMPPATRRWPPCGSRRRSPSWYQPGAMIRLS
ncbi:hypothetical protein GCM10011614_21340 [Novosphingobium colocasiae]|uniref:Potassium channel domain-containing protein n=1 Tax=Novosphingobium colocasiae TaxID=1256513 RepID=A0A918UGJ9_9SPHN|nr:hypothetical protein GCM10011614_21340 [Novosphingobium colocasiae]